LGVSIAPGPADPVVAPAMQLVAAAIQLTVSTCVAGIASQIDAALLPARAWWALAFPVIDNTLIRHGFSKE